jgi:hypothetical protein
VVPHLLIHHWNRSNRFGDVAIEMIEGDVAPHNDKEYVCGELGYAFGHAFVKKPLVGASLGVGGRKGSATLGGYMAARVYSSQGDENPQVLNLALSCHHAFTGTFEKPLCLPSLFCLNPQT